MKKLKMLMLLLLTATYAQAMLVSLQDIENMKLDAQNKAALVLALGDYVAVDNDIWFGVICDENSVDYRRNYAQEIVGIMDQYGIDLETEPVLKKWLKQAFNCQAQNAIVVLQEAGVEVN